LGLAPAAHRGRGTTLATREACGLFLKWLRNEKAREIAESPISNAEKIALLRQPLFADVDELEKSGEVALPE
jgi:hypothetical protein